MRNAVCHNAPREGRADSGYRPELLLRREVDINGRELPTLRFGARDRQCPRLVLCHKPAAQ